MNRDCMLLRDSLDALVADGFAALSPDRIAALEAHLNSCRDCAERIGAARPSDVSDGVRMAARAVVPPTAAEWESVWNRVEVATQGNSSVWSAGGRGIWRRAWRPLAGVAACVMIVAAWRFASPIVQPRLFVPPPVDGLWRLADAGDVEVLEFEVGDGMTAVVGGGPTALWVIEPNEGDSS